MREVRRRRSRCGVGYKYKRVSVILIIKYNTNGRKKNRHDRVRRWKGDYNIIIIYEFSMSLQPEDATQFNGSGGGGYAR